MSCNLLFMTLPRIPSVQQERPDVSFDVGKEPDGKCYNKKGKVSGTCAPGSPARIRPTAGLAPTMLQEHA